MSHGGLYAYRQALGLKRQDAGFHALIFAAMMKADTENAALLREAYPELWEELDIRYNAPGGWLPGEEPTP